MCAFDDKRYLLADGISTLAFGHRSIKVIENGPEEPAVDGDAEPAVLSAEQVRAYKMPLVKRKQMPIGQEPRWSICEAHRVRAASMPQHPPAAKAEAPLVATDELMHYMIDDE